MTRWIEQLLQNDSLNQTKELFTEKQKDKLIEDFMSNCFDKNNCLTFDWYEILTKLRTIWDNEKVYNQVSNEFKTNIRFNLEKHRQIPQKENNEKIDIINKWIEAEYSYVDQNKFWQPNTNQENNKKESKEFNTKDLNTFSKMQLTELYEICEWNHEIKKDFVIALMKNDENIYKNEYLAIIAKDIKPQIPYFTQNIYASNWVVWYNKIDENRFFISIWNKLSEIWLDIKQILETWVWTISNVWDIVKKSFENWEKKETNLIKDFNNKYEILSKDLKTSNDKTTWFSWSIIQDKETWVKTLLIRWSDDWKDWLKNNIQIVLKTKLPPQIESIINFIEEAKTKWIIKPQEKINIVWHSLGWWLAQITSMMYREDIEKTYTFNAPWIAWIETNIETKNDLVKNKVKEYKTQLETYKKQKETKI